MPIMSKARIAWSSSMVNMVKLGIGIFHVGWQTARVVIVGQSGDFRNRSFWALREETKVLKKETREYVPQIFALIFTTRVHNRYQTTINASLREMLRLSYSFANGATLKLFSTSIAKQAPIHKSSFFGRKRLWKVPMSSIHAYRAADWHSTSVYCEDAHNLWYTLQIRGDQIHWWVKNCTHLGVTYVHFHGRTIKPSITTCSSLPPPEELSPLELKEAYFIIDG